MAQRPVVEQCVPRPSIEGEERTVAANLAPGSYRFLVRAVNADGQVSAEVVHVDGFGNLQLSAPCRLLDEAGIATGGQVVLQVGAAVRPATVCAAFDDVRPGGIAVLPDAFDRLQIAVNRGSAARLLGADVGDAVLVRRVVDAPRAR